MAAKFALLVPGFHKIGSKSTTLGLKSNMAKPISLCRLFRRHFEKSTMHDAHKHWVVWRHRVSGRAKGLSKHLPLRNHWILFRPLRVLRKQLFAFLSMKNYFSLLGLPQGRVKRLNLVQKTSVDARSYADRFRTPFTRESP